MYLVYEEENSFLMPLVKVYALESDIWEHFSCLSKHSDIYRTMLFLIKVAQKGEEA